MKAKRYRKIGPIMSRLGARPAQVWQIQCHGKSMRVETYGMCHWSRVVFLWEDGRKFYRLTRNMKTWGEKGDKNTPRKEYFCCHMARQYVGEQNCFVEFFNNLREHSEIPTPEIFAQVIQELGLDKATAERYVCFYKRHFCS